MKHLPSLLLFLFNILASSDYIHWEKIKEPSLPEESESMMCGFDAQTNTTWLINQWRITSYADNEFTSQGIAGGFSSSKTWAQAYTVIDRTLWMIGFDYPGISLHIFDFANKTSYADYLIVPYEAITSQSDSIRARYSCLASWLDDDDRYLIVNGGTWYDWRANGKDCDHCPIYQFSSSKLLNIASETWIEIIPDMNSARSKHACVVVDDILYSIGGAYGGSSNYGSSIYAEWYRDTIEKLDLSEMDSWSTLSGRLSESIAGHRAVIYDEDILIIGGYNGGYSEPVLYDGIHLLNTATDAISKVGTLAFPVALTCAVVQYPYVYAFGGSATLWQRTYDFVPTLSPTSNPVSVDLSDDTISSQSESESSSSVSVIMVVIALLVFGCFVMTVKYCYKKATLNSQTQQVNKVEIQPMTMVPVQNIQMAPGQQTMTMAPVQYNNAVVAGPMMPNYNIVAVSSTDDEIGINNGTTKGAIYEYNNAAPSAPMAVNAYQPQVVTTTAGMQLEYNNVPASAPFVVQDDKAPPVYEAPPEYNEVIGGTSNGGEGTQNEGIYHERTRVKEWFESDVNLEDVMNEEYFNLFVDNGFDKLSTIKNMTADELKEIGIGKLGHRKAILTAIQHIQ